MIKPDWNTFKAKFSENPQNNFEWFCYILFCKEFNQEKGIFRFKNQSGIETNPIEHEKETIGWQSKFYETSLPSHKDEILSTLEKTKKDYPNITKIFFYTNQEWGQNKGKPPQGLIAIEKKAKELAVTLEWRTASFFESFFVCSENQIVAKHFFTSDKSIFDLIEEQKSHTENILASIQTNITFNGQSIEINREDELEKIKNTQQQVLILSGVGGAGKTALIKKLYQNTNGKVPFYIFKATEFELRNINEFFKNFDFQNFVDAHKEKEKIIVIDSAEKLLDLKNSDPFKEILSILIKNNWQIIFTSRNNYLDDLRYHFFEIYKVSYLNIFLQNLDQDTLQILSNNYSFQLPKDKKLFELIKNPFYLAEYLKYYDSDKELDYKEFKGKLWKQNITKSNPPRSDCFQKIAFLRANTGSFFIMPQCESNILNELFKDGILGYEDDHGYFITHDIYEEWALEKIITKEFQKKEDNLSFFDAIGQSLPIRRSFRNWGSEKLLLEEDDIKEFIEEIINDQKIDQSWKNEVLVSILLSDYSDHFFDSFKELLLDNNQGLLKKITFWLQIACKEVDEDFLQQLGIKNIDLSTLRYVLTKPKGKGWESVIRFVFNSLEVIGIKNIYFILPIVYDWNNKFRIGETTKYASLIALQYYQWRIIEDFPFYDNDEIKDKLFQTILYGSAEIKNELKQVFTEILKNKWKNHRDPYYDLSKTILTQLEGTFIAKILPEYVLKLANLFWTHSHEEQNQHPYSRMNIKIESDFGIEESYQEYFPASAYQTPIYGLLQSAQKETINFILDFTNKAVENFSQSELKHEIQEVEVFFDEKITVKQYICDRLWCTYRGTKVSPDVLASMHMALEKFLLESGKNTPSKILENWLIYLLKNSKSASISAVVTSIVLAFPDKTFNVAQILFQTKEFFLYETSRWTLDQGHKSQLLMLKNNFSIGSKNSIYENERLEACDDKHRQWHLENLFLQYQVFKNENVTEEEVKERQKILWEILDTYYTQLPKESEQTQIDETWRMFLARMDYRKMKPTTKKTEKGIEIHWNPKIEPKLREKSEISLKKSNEPMQYITLKMWAYYRIKSENDYKQYEKYEKNPRHALEEVKEIISKLKAIKIPKNLEFEISDKESFFLLNYSIPAEVCSVLIRDFLDDLSKKDILFCKDIILDVASSSLRSNYQYEISDGVQSAISVLPLLLDKFSEEDVKEKIKITLLLTLFDEYPIGIWGGKFNYYSIMAIHKLWKNNFKDADSLLLGYLLLKPKYEKLRKKLRKENYKNGIYKLNEAQIVEKFLEENNNDLQKIIANKITINDFEDIEKLELSFLGVAFQLISLKIEDSDHKQLVKKIISVFAQKLTSDDRNDKVDYIVGRNFLEKLAYLVLSANQEAIEEYLQPFIDNFNNSEIFSELFKQFISAEDQLNTYENFWKAWELFKEKVAEICKKRDSYWRIEEIVKSYFFATAPWKDTTTSWHSLKEKNKGFFKEMSQKLGHCPSVLYAISKLLNDIGSSYLDDGIFWLSDMLKNNKNLLESKLEVNTIYYVENLARKYIHKNHEKIKRIKKTKNEILIILDFLIQRGSVIGYILRESIL